MPAIAGSAYGEAGAPFGAGRSPAPLGSPTTSTAASRAPERAAGPRGELLALVHKLEAQQRRVVRKEQELVELRGRLHEEERSLDTISKASGARDQRVNVATLRGPPKTKQVGAEMAAAIRKRQLRRKDTLRDKLNKLTTRLGEIQASNRGLKQTISDRRLARLNHHAALRHGDVQVERADGEIAELITAAQRAYAEKMTIVLRLDELRKKASEESELLAREIDECEEDVCAIEDECRGRDACLDELAAEVAEEEKAARAAEGAREAEIKSFGKVRDTRLGLQASLDRIFEALHVGSLAELTDTYRTTASKVLSLWGKQGEQEGEVDLLRSEIKQLSLEVGAARQRQEAGSPTLMRSSRSASNPEVASNVSDAYLAQREALMHELCRHVAEAFTSTPMLRDPSLEVPVGEDLSDGTADVVPNTLLAFLGLIEGIATKLAASSRGYEPLPTPEPLPNSEPPDLSAKAGRRGSAASLASARSASIAAEPPGTPGRRRKTEPLGGRRRVGVVPPPLEVGQLIGLVPTDPKKDVPPEAPVGAAGMNSNLKYGRASLRSELMQKILGGVAQQMERLSEEEANERRGEGSGGGVGSRAPGKPPYASSGALINKHQRDSSIDEWLARRRGGPPSHGPFSAADFGAPSLSAASLASSVGVGGRIVPRPKGSTRRLDAKPPREAYEPGPGLRGNRSAPVLFASVSGRELLDTVTKLDRAQGRAFAAEMLPKLPEVTCGSAGSGGVHGAAVHERGLHGLHGASTLAGCGAPAGAGSAAASSAGGGALGGGAGGGSLGSLGSLMSFEDGDPLNDPKREIAEINRRLALLETERLQIHSLKASAVASANLAPGAGHFTGGETAPPPPRAADGEAPRGKAERAADGEAPRGKAERAAPPGGTRRAPSKGAAAGLLSGGTRLTSSKSSGSLPLRAGGGRAAAPAAVRA